MLFRQNTDKLRDNHGWMRIVNLNNRILRQIMQIASTRNCFLHNKLGSIGNHKVLLIYTKQLAIPIGIIRIQEEREVLLQLRLIKTNGIVRHQRIINALKIKEA